MISKTPFETKLDHSSHSYYSDLHIPPYSPQNEFRSNQLANVAKALQIRASYFDQNRNFFFSPQEENQINLRSFFSSPSLNLLFQTSKFNVIFLPLIKDHYTFVHCLFACPCNNHSQQKIMSSTTFFPIQPSVLPNCSRYTLVFLKTFRLKIPLELVIFSQPLCNPTCAPNINLCSHSVL